MSQEHDNRQPKPAGHKPTAHRQYHHEAEAGEGLVS